MCLFWLFHFDYFYLFRLIIKKTHLMYLSCRNAACAYNFWVDLARTDTLSKDYIFFIVSGWVDFFKVHMFVSGLTVKICRNPSSREIFTSRNYAGLWKTFNSSPIAMEIGERSKEYINKTLNLNVPQQFLFVTPKIGIEIWGGGYITAIIVWATSRIRIENRRCV